MYQHVITLGVTLNWTPILRMMSQRLLSLAMVELLNQKYGGTLSHIKCFILEREDVMMCMLYVIIQVQLLYPVPYHVRKQLTVLVMWSGGGDLWLVLRWRLLNKDQAHVPAHAACLSFMLNLYMVPEVWNRRVMAAHSNTKNIPSLDLESGNVSENRSQWRELIELVFAGPDADRWSDQQKAAHFLICVGQKGRDVCRAWQACGDITAEDRKKTVCKVWSILQPKEKLHSAKETVLWEEAVWRWVSGWMGDCAFYDAGDMIKDRILMGSTFKEVQEKLLQKEERTCRYWKEHSSRLMLQKITAADMGKKKNIQE